MNETLYEVLFIDKTKNEEQAEEVRAQLQQHFGLNRDALDKLFTGKPVVVKQNVDLKKAEHLAQTIKADGGECWVQEMGLTGDHEERRSTFRRAQVDRRDYVRASAILPDRRKNDGRRTDDSE